MGTRTYTEALRLARDTLTAGWAVVVDGSFSTSAERRRVRDLAAELPVPLTVLWCDAPDDVIARRLRRRGQDRHEVSDGREELLALHRARYETPTDEPEVIRLDTARDPAGDLDSLMTRAKEPADLQGAKT